MFYPNCGYENNDENKFCMKCGNEIPQGMHTDLKESVSQENTVNVSHQANSTGNTSDVAIEQNTAKKSKFKYIVIPAIVLITAAVVIVLVMFALGKTGMKNTNKYRIAAAAHRAVVVNDDGTVTAYLNEELLENPNSIRALMVATSSGQCDVSKWKDITAVAASSSYTVGVKKDGTVVATGGLSGYVSKLNDVVSVSLSDKNLAAVKKDGTVITTNANLDVSDWKDIVDVSTTDDCIIGRKKDGTLVFTKEESESTPGTVRILNDLLNIISEWKDIADVSLVDGGSGYPLVCAVKDDGTMLAIFNSNGEWTNAITYDNWKDIAAYSGGLGIKKDGTVITENEEWDISNWKDIIAVSVANKSTVVGLKKDGTLISTEPLVEYDKDAVDKILNS